METRQTEVFKKDIETNYIKKEVLLNNKEFIDVWAFLSAMLFKISRFVPITILIGASTMAISLGWTDYLSINKFEIYREEILVFIQGDYLFSVFIFTLIYLVSTALSIPGALFLTIIGGYLFGPILGAAYSLVGATIGAGILFLSARTAFGTILRARVGPAIEKIRLELKKNAFFYLLSLRLVPVFPFFVVNLAPAFLNIKFGVYILASLLGMMPGALVYALIGSGLRHSFESGEGLPLVLNMSSEFLVGLFGLAVLSLLPIFFKWRKRKIADKIGCD